MCNLQQTIRNVDGDPDHAADTRLFNKNSCHCDIVTNCTNFTVITQKFFDELL